MSAHVSLGAELRLGFVPLNDAAPLVVAREKGFFRAEGLGVELSREVSWATIRDKVAAGALDAAHMLSPIPIACTLGLGGEPQPMIAPLALNLNGSAVTLARRLLPAPVAAARDAATALAAVIAARRAAGAPPPTFAVVFPYSMHNYLLRYWLANAGIDPEQDVRITVAPPSRMAGKLAAGELDGFCAGQPWNTLAVDQGVGVIATRASETWRDGPEKVLGVTTAWAERRPEALQALLRAVLRAAAWADAPDNRRELAQILSQPQYVGVDGRLIEASLPETAFHRGGANAPLPAHAGWALSQMVRWGQAPGGLDIAAVARRVYRPDLYDEAAAALGLPPAAFPEVLDGFVDGRVFRLEAAGAYAESFPLSRPARA